jgi:hypothetical protein
MSARTIGHRPGKHRNGNAHQQLKAQGSFPGVGLAWSHHQQTSVLVGTIAALARLGCR